MRRQPTHPAVLERRRSSVLRCRQGNSLSHRSGHHPRRSAGIIERSLPAPWPAVRANPGRGGAAAIPLHQKAWKLASWDDLPATQLPAGTPGRNRECCARAIQLERLPLPPSSGPYQDRKQGFSDRRGSPLTAMDLRRVRSGAVFRAGCPQPTTWDLARKPGRSS